MGQPIKIFEKNKLDISNSSVVITASQGQPYVNYIRNRNNTSGWATTGSVDADNTNLVIDWADTELIDHVILLMHNFKSYTIKYWDGAAYQDFSPSINVSANTAVSTKHIFTGVTTTKIKLTITGTMVTNDDKFLRQLIATKLFGQLDGYPIITNPEVSRNRTVNRVISGKQNIIDNLGSFKCSLKVPNWKSDADLTIVESLYHQPEGLLLWLCGGDETQFSSRREGYRLEDLYLVKTSNEWKPEWYKGIYPSGMKIQVDLQETID